MAEDGPIKWQIWLLWGYVISQFLLLFGVIYVFIPNNEYLFPALKPVVLGK